MTSMVLLDDYWYKQASLFHYPSNTMYLFGGESDGKYNNSVFFYNFSSPTPQWINANAPAPALFTPYLTLSYVDSVDTAFFMGPYMPYNSVDYNNGNGLVLKFSFVSHNWTVVTATIPNNVVVPCSVYDNTTDLIYVVGGSPLPSGSGLIYNEFVLWC